MRFATPQTDIRVYVSVFVHVNTLTTAKPLDPHVLYRSEIRFWYAYDDGH